MSTEQDVATFRQLIERGFNQGDLSVVDEIVSPDCVEHQRGLKPGIEGVKDTILTLRRWFSDFHLVIEDIAVDGGKIWARNLGRGVNTGSVMGHPPTGKAITVDVFDVCRFENGKMVEHWGVPDQLGLLLQLGVLPKPGVAASASR